MDPIIARHGRANRWYHGIYLRRSYCHVDPKMVSSIFFGG
jgi:hypothetical protein